MYLPCMSFREIFVRMMLDKIEAMLISQFVSIIRQSGSTPNELQIEHLFFFSQIGKHSPESLDEFVILSAALKML